MTTNNKTNTERTVDEVVDELCKQLTDESIFWVDGNEEWNISNNFDACELIKNTILAERQRAEGVVREIYQEIEKHSPDYYSTAPTPEEFSANRYTRSMLDKFKAIATRNNIQV